MITTYNNNFEEGTFSFGVDFNYRLKNIDHLGFDIKFKFIFFEIDIEFSDDRHLEDYQKSDY
ncbi:MAG: hypothetical protein PHE78_05090 [Candidatus Gastranaerophilales bacterium]|nr:hypothetical protein [Candidatus Gastranaerophilales bacterium]